MTSTSDPFTHRRMVRSFDGTPVTEAELDTVLRAARRAPTAGNTQGWALVTLQTQESRQAFWDATTDAGWRQRSRRWPQLRRAPAIITVHTNPDRYTVRYAAPDKATSGLATHPWPVPFWFFDAGAAVDTMLLAATAIGLGSCFLGNFRGAEALHSALGVPAGWHYVGAVLLGRSASDDPRSPSLADPWRHSKEMIHHEKW